VPLTLWWYRQLLTTLLHKGMLTAAHDGCVQHFATAVRQAPCATCAPIKTQTPAASLPSTDAVGMTLAAQGAEPTALFCSVR